MHHKRGRPRNRRAGCKLCKPWKVNGFRTERIDGEKFSDHRRRGGRATRSPRRRPLNPRNAGMAQANTRCTRRPRPLTGVARPLVSAGRSADN